MLGSSFKCSIVILKRVISSCLRFKKIEQDKETAPGIVNPSRFAYPKRNRWIVYSVMVFNFCKKFKSNIPTVLLVLPYT